MTAEPGFHRPFDTRRIGEPSSRETVEATTAECASIAAFLDVLSLQSLAAELEIARWSASGIAIEGRLRATATQACVVTLEPVQQVIDEPFRRTFLPPQAKAIEPKTVAEAEVVVAFDEDDPPDDLEGPVLDLGPILVEQLALALDPYPRAPGAKLDDNATTGDDSSPFAALSRLRRD